MGQGNSLAHAKRELWGLSLKKVLVRSRSGRIFENPESPGLGHVEGPFWSKNIRFRCAAHNVLKNGAKHSPTGRR